MNQPSEVAAGDRGIDKNAFPIGIRALHDAYANELSPVRVVEHVFDAIAETDDPGIFISMAKLEDVRAAARALGPFDPVAKPL